MHKLRQFYHQNKNKIKFIVAFIIFILVIIQLINKAYKNNKSEILLGNTDNLQNETYLKTNTQILSNQSVVTGEDISNLELNAVSKIIDQFISTCNDGNIEQAYELLSSDCKNVIYKNLQRFKELYYDKVFGDNGNKNITIENWISNTYRVNFYDDIIETGKISDKNTQDYITIVKENGNIKLNINSFVRVENINQEQEINGLVFNVISKNVFMDYEEYTIEIQNKTDNKILLDTQQNPKTIYLEDSKGIKYYASSNEIISSLLEINNGFSTQISIKFIRKHTSASSKIESIVFSDVIFNTQENKNKATININL